jgi:hypothetical protein
MPQNQFYPQNMNMNNQQIMPQEQPQNLIRVNGIDGAKAYQMNANSTVALFKFDEVTETTKSEEKQDYISRKEFEEFKKELMNNGKQSIQRSKSNLTDKSSSN